MEETQGKPTDEGAVQPPPQPPQRRKAMPVLVVELDEADAAATTPPAPPSAPAGPPAKMDGRLTVEVSPDAPAVVLPPSPHPLPGAPAALAIGVAAMIACFIPVVNLIAPLLGAAAAGTGLLMLRRLNRDTHLTGRGVINTAILLGVIATVLGVLCYTGWVAFWFGAQ